MRNVDHAPLWVVAESRVGIWLNARSAALRRCSASPKAKLTIKVPHAPRRLDNPVQHARADARYRLRAVRSARAVQRGPADDGARRRQTGRLSADCPKARSVSFRVPERSCERASDKECIGYDFKILLTRRTLRAVLTEATLT